MNKAYLWLYLLLGSLAVILPFGAYQLEAHYKEIRREQMLISAKTITALVEKTRTKYSKEAISKLLKTYDIRVGHEHSKYPDMLPVPATFSIELAQSISNDIQRIWMYSNDPFPWRKETSVPKNDLERYALEYLTQNPDKEFTQMTNELFFYASPIIMRSQECVDCHNSLADNPRHDWKVGDVRSILAFSFSLDKTESAKRQFDSLLWVFWGLIFLIIATICILIIKLKQLDRRTKQATEDPLTDMPNRLFIYERVMPFIESRKQFTGTAGKAIVLLDVDHFKHVNDNYGHDTGDECLQSIAKILMDGFKRKNDFVARWGGEEFILILTDKTKNEVSDTVEHVRRTIGSTFHSKKELTITISAGCCFIEKNQDFDFNHASKIADEALYEAKNNGRNQLIVRDYVPDPDEKHSTG